VLTADPGDEITYTLTYANTGTGAATGVVITDTIDAQTTFVSASPAPDGSSGDTYTWSIGTVAAGGSGSISVTVAVDAYTPDGTVLTNGATLDYDDANGNPQSPLADDADVTVTAPLMSVAKSANVVTADPGDLITYTITYANSGTGEATDVVIVDILPAAVTFVSSSPSPDSNVGGVLTWNIGSVAGGASGGITVVVEVNAYTADGTLLHNVVTLDYDDANGNPQDLQQDSVDVTVTAPILSVSKTVDEATADPGDEVTYTITYTNSGTGEATDVTIVDTLPAFTTFVSASPAPDSNVGGVLTWNIGSVTGGSGGSITVTVEVDAGTADGTVLTNGVTLDYDDANGNPQGQQGDSVDVSVTAPVMTFSKTSDVTTADPGDTITYTLSFTNYGSGDASGVVVVDTIPADTTFVTASPYPDDVTGDVLTWYVGLVTAGGSGSITITVQVDAGLADGTLLHNAATLDYDDANGNFIAQLTDDADVIVTAPVVTFSKSADVLTADPSDSIAYTLSYANTGSGEATDVTIVDTLPADVTFVTATPYPDFVGGGTLIWYLGSVAAGGSGSISVTVEVNAYTADGTLLTNSATLTYDDANGNARPPLDDDADVTVTAPVLTLIKSADVAFADPGDFIVYTLSYSNTGSGKATEVTIVDTIPAQTTFVGSVPPYTSVLGDTYTWVLGDVAGGASGSITLTVQVDAFTPDGTVLTNDATLDYDDANGNPYPQLSDDASTTVTAPVMTFAKSADVTQADPGDAILYTLEYCNAGGGEATDVTIVDTLPADVTFIDADPDPTSTAGQVLTWVFPSVAAGECGTILVTVTVNPGTSDGTLLDNDGTLDYDDANGNAQDQLADDAQVTVTAPVMTFSKTADVSEADPSDLIVYTLSYTNTGSGAASGVVVQDTISAATTFVTATPYPDMISGDILTWLVGGVPAGGSGSITVTVSVDAYTPDETLLVNSASLDYDDANGNFIETLSDSAETAVTAPVLTFSKTADVSEADPGDDITYTLIYANTGTGAATGVVIVDTIPAYTTFVSATPAPDSNVGGVLTWNLAPLPGGASGSITVVVNVNAGSPDGALLVNSATLDYDDANGNPYPQLSDDAATSVTAPVGAFTKEADVSTADPSDSITYTLTFTNAGSGDATNVWINDTIPAATTFVSADPLYDEVSGDTYRWHFDLVGPGDSVTVTLVVVVDAYTADQALLHNVATTEYSDANGNFVETLFDYADVSVTAPVLSISKSADVLTADPGDTITYTIVVTNTGTGTATDLVIVDTLPGPTTYVSATPAPDSAVGDVLTWVVSSLAGGSSISITITATVDAYTADQTILHNVATVDFDDANGNPYPQLSDAADVTVTAPVMTFSKTVDALTADPSDEFTYTLTYANTGTGEATDVTVVDTLPADVTYVGAVPAPTSIIGQVLTWNLGSVAGGSGGSITVTVRVNAYTPDQTVLHNTATLDYDDANGNAQDQLSDYADVSVTAPVMTFAKAADTTTADPGDVFHYTLTYANVGTGTATAVVVVDVLPPEVTFVSAVPAPSSIVGQTLTWDLGAVVGGSGGSITVTVQVNVGTGDQTLLHNAATLDFDDANGNPYPQLTGYADVVVTAPVMTFSKTVDVSTADPSDEFTYTLTYANVGTGMATGVVIVDTLPPEVTFLDADPDPDGIVGQVLTWNLGAVAGGSGGSVTVTVRVNAYTPDQTVLHNTATLDYDDANGNFVDQLSGYADVSVTAPVIAFSKSGPGTVVPGEPVTYTLTYANLGTGTATDVVIVDTLPPEVTFGSSTPPPDAVVGDLYFYFIGSLGPGASGTITITVRVAFPLSDGTLILNGATLDHDDANGNPYPQQDDSTTALVLAGSIGDLVWDDSNVNSAYDLGESGVDGVTVVLTGTTAFGGLVSLGTTTAGGGLYLFDGLGPGTFTVAVVVPVGWVATTPESIALTLAADEDYLGADFGIAQPEISKSMEATGFDIDAFVIADITLRVAGEKWHDVRVDIINHGVVTATLQVIRMPGSPDRQAVTLIAGHFSLLGDPTIVVYYTPDDDPINGQKNGDNPTWIIVAMPDGKHKRLFHNFNENHPATWVWYPEDFMDIFEGQEIHFVVTAKLLEVTLQITNPYVTVDVVDTLPPELAYTGNGLDDDGDGLVDEEALNGVDDDGDGFTDEDLGGLRVNGAFITGGLVVSGNTLTLTLARGLYTVQFEVETVVTVSGPTPVLNLAQMVADGSVVAESTSTFDLYLFSGIAGDGVDNDGDGLIDEEALNGVDDDGDGYVDEDLEDFWSAAAPDPRTQEGSPKGMQLTGFAPLVDPTIREGETQAFSVSERGDGGAVLEWYVEGTLLGQGTAFAFSGPAGAYLVALQMAFPDGLRLPVRTWSLVVQDGTTAAPESPSTPATAPTNAPPTPLEVDDLQEVSGPKPQAVIAGAGASSALPAVAKNVPTAAQSPIPSASTMASKPEAAGTTPTTSSALAEVLLPAAPAGIAGPTAPATLPTTAPAAQAPAAVVGATASPAILFPLLVVLLLALAWRRPEA
ncbi:MAG TPA: SdrD B-like domain-containing protein, partial [Thermoplasmata archaeon]|nr:SdrD B-like domain-containing protein [Thermoplasmata archaeon]